MPRSKRLAATLSNHAITETAVSGVREEASHDRLVFTEHSAEVPPDRSSAPSAAAGTVGGKERSRGVRTLLYAVIRTRHSDFRYRDLGLDASRTVEAGSAVHHGDRLDRGDGSKYALVRTNCYLTGWIAAGLHRRSPIAALDTTPQPAPSHRCARDRRGGYTVFLA